MKLNIVLPTASLVSSTPRHAHTYVCRLAVLRRAPVSQGAAAAQAKSVYATSVIMPVAWW